MSAIQVIRNTMLTAALLIAWSGRA